MENEGLAEVIKWILDIGLAVYVGSIIYGLFAKRVFALGTWYHRNTEPSKYWQSILGFSILVIVVAYLRIRFFTY